MTKFPILAALALSAGLFAPMTADAQSKRTQLRATDAVDLNDGRAYVYYRSNGRNAMQFLRSVTPEEAAEHAVRRTEALTKARERYARQLRNWEANREADRKRGINSAKPVEPTDENFAFAGPEADNFVEVNQGRVFWNAKPEYGYLLALEPGEYTIVGPITNTGQALVGTCMCMGSVRFEVKAGVVNDLGHLLVAHELSAGDVPELAPHARGDARAATHLMGVRPESAGSSLPTTIPAGAIARVDYRAAPKMPNHFGVVINRIAPLPGVIAYDEDRVIDLKQSGFMDARNPPITE